MKIFIASDIHGSAYYAERIISAAKKENADLIVLLGDVYNHGPRNPLPKDYNPMRVAEILNAEKNALAVIKGNCDSDVDALISDFDFVPHMLISQSGKKIFLTHGDVFNSENLPKTFCECIIFGHFHVAKISKKGETVCVNCGSASLPKDENSRGYVLINEKTLSLKDLNGNVLDKTEL